MIIEAILKINPNAKVTVRGDDIENRDLGKVTIEWLDGTTPIPKADIEVKMLELQVEYDAKQYQRDRASKYPELKEQLDLQYKDLLNGTTTWKDAVAKVKTDNPKD